MKILLTGGTGLIGKKLGTRLVKAGHSVRVLTRKAHAARETCPFPAEFVESMGQGFPAQMLEGVDAIIHLAGESVAAGRWTPSRKKKIRESRVDFTKNLMNHVRVSGPSVKHIVMASAVGYYGDRKDEELTETSSGGTGFLAEICRDWEKELFQAPLGTRRIRRVALRTGVVLSDQGGALEKLMPIFEKGVGGPVGSGRQWMSWIHLEDLVEMFLFHLEKETEGTYNAVAPNPVTNKEFSKALGLAYGKPSIIPAPEFGLWIAFGEMAQIILGSQKVLSKKTTDFGFKFKFSDIHSALKDLIAERREGYHVFQSEQWIPSPAGQIFDFFADEKNLEKITPPWLNFHVKYKTTPKIQAGTLINYELKLNGIPFFWQTLIDSWEPPFEFVDVQKKGPYAVWKHRHQFEPLGKGTMMKDRVLYKLPLGILGEVVAGWKVHSDVLGIFQYRRRIVSQIEKEGG
ncbi:MAG: TIGR01777 family oxidoreductase [Bdellovibrionales bacterium]|nr:TIGR01777 family oxidoreductase [Bdellovibrionales bacterium]